MKLISAFPDRRCLFVLIFMYHSHQWKALSKVMGSLDDTQKKRDLSNQIAPQPPAKDPCASCMNRHPAFTLPAAFDCRTTISPWAPLPLYDVTTKQQDEWVIHSPCRPYRGSPIDLQTPRLFNRLNIITTQS